MTVVYMAMSFHAPYKFGNCLNSFITIRYCRRNRPREFISSMVSQVAGIRNYHIYIYFSERITLPFRIIQEENIKRKSQNHKLSKIKTRNKDRPRLRFIIFSFQKPDCRDRNRHRLYNEIIL